MIRALFHLGLSLMIVTSVAEATILRVPNEYPTIQAGIDASADGDTVLVASGTYVNQQIWIWKTISLRSEQGPRSCIISVHGSDRMLAELALETRMVRIMKLPL